MRCHVFWSMHYMPTSLQAAEPSAHNLATSTRLMPGCRSLSSTAWMCSCQPLSTTRQLTSGLLCPQEATEQHLARPPAPPSLSRPQDKHPAKAPPAPEIPPPPPAVTPVQAESSKGTRFSAPPQQLQASSSASQPPIPPPNPPAIPPPPRPPPSIPLPPANPRYGAGYHFPSQGC